MALKKADLLELRDRYEAAMARARTAEARGMYKAAVEAAVEAWPCIDGMMQYRRRFEEAEFDSVAAIDFVLRYAPLLFNSSVLERLAAMLKAEKRIEKNTEADLGVKLTKAKECLWLNHQLFSHLENHPGTRQDLLRTQIGGDQNYWRSTCEAWGAMGILRREPAGASYKLTLITRLGEIVQGKCPQCGTRAHAPKAMFLELLNCAHCERSVHFVLVDMPAGIGG